MIKRKFKHVTDEQLIELSRKIEVKFHEGLSIEEALMSVQAYACCEELLSTREKLRILIQSLEAINKDVEKNYDPNTGLNDLIECFKEIIK